MRPSPSRRRWRRRSLRRRRAGRTTPPRSRRTPPASRLRSRTPRRVGRSAGVSRAFRAVSPGRRQRSGPRPRRRPHPPWCRARPHLPPRRPPRPLRLLPRPLPPRRPPRRPGLLLRRPLPRRPPQARASAADCPESRVASPGPRGDRARPSDLRSLPGRGGGCLRDPGDGGAVRDPRLRARRCPGTALATGADISAPLPWTRTVWNGRAPRHLPDAASAAATARRRPTWTQAIATLFGAAALGVLAAAAVALVRTLLSLPFMQDFLAAFLASTSHRSRSSPASRRGSTGRTSSTCS